MSVRSTEAVLALQRRYSYLVAGRRAAHRCAPSPPAGRAHASTHQIATRGRETCLDLPVPDADRAAAPAQFFSDVGAGASLQLLLEFAVDALEVAQFHVLGDHRLRLLDESALHGAHLQQQLVHARVAALHTRNAVVARRIIYLRRPRAGAGD